jgi:FixJ family two-component response regulator
VRSGTGRTGLKFPVDRLSDRELEVFRLIGQGHATRRIAEELHLSVKTVESYHEHIKEKMLLGAPAQRSDPSANKLLQHLVGHAITQIDFPAQMKIDFGNAV